MEPHLDLFSIAAASRGWSSSKHTTAAQNIAHLNTPGYQARDIIAFSEYLDGLASKSDGDKMVGMVTLEERPSSEKQFAAAGDALQQFTTATAISRSFHRMLLASTKG